MSIFEFGLIADPQVGNEDDSESIELGFDSNDDVRLLSRTVTHKRYYREAFEKTKNAFDSWKVMASSSSFNFKFAVVLGDILDSKCISSGTVEDCFLKYAEVTAVPFEVHTVVGNNDIKCFGRTKFFQLFTPTALKSIISPSSLYYSTTPFPGFRFIFLDAYDVSCIGASTEELTEVANEILRFHNPEVFAPGGDCFSEASKYHFQKYNGQLSTAQIIWLDRTLQQSEADGEKCFVFCHLPIELKCCRPDALLWNYDEIIAVVHKTRCVQAWISGHDHDGGYAVDSSGIHHVTPCAPIECSPGELSHGYVKVCEGGFEICWTGKTPHRFRGDSPWPTQLIPYRLPI